MEHGILESEAEGKTMLHDDKMLLKMTTVDIYLCMHLHQIPEFQKVLVHRRIKPYCLEKNESKTLLKTGQRCTSKVG